MIYIALVLFLLNPVSGKWEDSGELAEAPSMALCGTAVQTLLMTPGFPESGVGLACVSRTRV